MLHHYSRDSITSRTYYLAQQASTGLVAARFAKAFVQLQRSGVPILYALEVVAGTTGNLAASKVLMDSREVVLGGEPLSAALTKQTVLPQTLVEMLQAGEETGKIDEMLGCIGDFYDDEVKIMFEGLTALLEPLLMVFLGVVIGGIVISLFLPIFMMPNIIG